MFALRRYRYDPVAFRKAARINVSPIGLSSNGHLIRIRKLSTSQQWMHCFPTKLCCSP